MKVVKWLDIDVSKAEDEMFALIARGKKDGCFDRIDEENYCYCKCKIVEFL